MTKMAMKKIKKVKNLNEDVYSRFGLNLDAEKAQNGFLIFAKNSLLEILSLYFSICVRADLCLLFVFFVEEYEALLFYFYHILFFSYEKRLLSILINNNLYLILD